MSAGRLQARRRAWASLGLVLALLLSGPVALAAGPASSAVSGQLLLPEFRSLGPSASDSVSIALDAPLLAIAARFLNGGDPDERALQELIRGLRGIYVKSYSFDRGFAYPAADVAAVRRQLTAPDWQRIVEVHDLKQQTAVDIYLCQAGEKTTGLALIATEPRQFTIVNIVGLIDLDKLHRLEGHFGIPKLDHPGGGRG